MTGLGEVVIREVRRGWSSHEGEEGWWFRGPEQQSHFKVKFTDEGEQHFFGQSSDASELQLPDALQFASHVHRSRGIADSNCQTFTSILHTASDPVPRLEHLHWSSLGQQVNPILDAIISKKLSKLTSLGIWFVRVDLDVLARAIESGCLPCLETLGLDGAYGHSTLAKVMNAGHLPQLKVLGLSYSMVDFECEAYATVFSSGRLPLLSTIDFSLNHRLGNKGVQALGTAVQSGKLENLAHLHLNWCRFGDDGVVAIADSFVATPHHCLLNLRTLDFSFNRFTDVGLLSLAHVLENGHLNSLEVLDLTMSGKFSKTGAVALVSALALNMHLNVQVLFEWEQYPALDRRRDQFLQRNARYRDILAGLVDSPEVPATFGKIYLCGNPEVGKTTLRHSLQRSLLKSLLSWERRPHTERRTRGINVSQFSSKGSSPGETPTTLLVWDMAGQRDYHLIHNAFFPDLGSIEGKATTFVVVCSSKSNVEESEKQLDYWLRFIASSCGKATQNVRHVMVVFNRIKGDQKVLKLAPQWKVVLESMRGKFVDYLDIWTVPFIVDVRRRRSVNDLRRCLLDHSINLLRDEKVPELCQFLQRNVGVWGEARKQFPVLHWTEFVAEVRRLTERQGEQECNAEHGMQLREPWGEKELEAATKYLNEAGVLIYIDKGFSGRRLVVLNPNWFCGNIVGNMLLHQDMLDPAEHLFRMEVDSSTGSISISKFKQFLNSLSRDWTPSHMEDLVAILLWLGLCYQGRDQDIFVPSLIAEKATPSHAWGSNSAPGHGLQCGEDHWVMGFLIQHHKNELTLVPIMLWHRFQVELAQMRRFNGHPDNDFVCGRYFITFSVEYMAVFIEVTANEGNPTFDIINVLVKPLLADDHLDGIQRKQCQVDLASDLVEILLKLWNEVCPGVGYLHRVIWPWPACWAGLHIMPQRNVDVEEVKKWVLEHNLGRKMQWMVGSSSIITEDQLLCSKDKDCVGKSIQKSLSILTRALEEAVDLGIYPRDVLSGEVSSKVRCGPLDEDVLELPRSTSGKWIMKKLEKMDEQLNEVDKKVGNLGQLSKEILKNQKRLQEKLQEAGDVFLQDKERSCPRFLFLGKKNSGRWVTLKEALSPSVSVQLHFACEARYDDYQQHAVKDQHGLEVSQLKKWAETIAPWLKVSLTALYISAKVAANVVAPGLGLILPNFGDWQEASSLLEGLAMATGFSEEALNKHQMEGMGVEGDSGSRDPQEIYGKSRAALSKFLGTMTPQAYEEKFGLRKVCLYYGDGSLHGIVWICNACFENFRGSNISMTEL